MTVALTIVLLIALQAGPATEWKDQAPSPAGWRNVRPGMTVDELIGALPTEAARDKDVKYADGTTGQKAKMKRKVKVDGIDYEVSFYFAADKHLESVNFFSNKVKKETLSAVVSAFTGLLGEPTHTDAKPFPDGSRTDSASWKGPETTLTVTSGTMPLGGFITGRLVTVTMNYKRPLNGK